VTLSSSSKTSKSKKTKHTKETKHKKEAKGSEKTHRSESSKDSSVQTYLREDDPSPVFGRGHSGPDDVDDDGACPGGNRKDNMDNPDSVVDNGGCGSSYDSGNNNYNGPDGSFYYDEYH
jgi:hypothetical protein